MPAVEACHQKPAPVSFFHFLTDFVFYLVFPALIVLRRPDCLTHSQFWAEDGATFYPDAMQRPLWENLIAYNFGYFDLLLRLMHQLAALFPLAQAPRVLAVVAIMIQAAVPAFLISRRTKTWLGSFPIRLVTAIVYCAMPNSFEVNAIALHSRVHLAVLASLIIVSQPAKRIGGRIFDLVVLVVSGLSGPFIFVLVPVALWRCWKERSATLKYNLIALCAVLPFGSFALLTTGPRRIVGQMGISLANFVRIIGGQFTTSFFLGEKKYASVLNQPWFEIVAWSGLIVFVLLVAIILCTGGREVRSLLFIGLGLLAMALSTPLAGFDRPHWVALWNAPGCGQRYYFPMMAVLLFGLAALTGRGQNRWWRWLGVASLGLIALEGARRDYILPPFIDYNFAERAKEYEQLPPGAIFVAPTNPPSWKVEVRKPVNPAN